MSRLEAWLEGHYMGQFIHADHGVIFQYDATAPDIPISLSLPRDGPPTRNAASNFLENLLPDHAAARVRMAAAYGASSASTFDLLARAGGDVAGGLVLLPEGTGPHTGAARLNPARDRDIAGRISAIKIDPDSYELFETPARFSLAGTQGKFALARVDGDWYWSNASVPSTHIVKPGSRRLPGIEQAEAAALNLARRAGIRSPSATVLQFDDQTAFVVERFDRKPGGVLSLRLHAEDLAQARGIRPDSKYDITARQVVETLRTVDADGALIRDFIQQLAFNIFIGNADAHAKNYSILLRPSGVAMSPLYDALPVMLYPQYDQRLAMRISGARRSQAVKRSHWQKLAKTSGLDPDETLSIVESLATAITAHNDAAWGALPDGQGEVVRAAVARNIDSLLADRS